MESIFYDLNKNHIAKQRFGLIITTIIFCIVLSYAYFFAVTGLRYLVYCLYLMLEIYVLFSFMSYLRNFVAAKPVLLMKLKLTGICALFGLLVIGLLLAFMFAQGLTIKEYRILSQMLEFLVGGVTLFDFFVSMSLGISLQKIPNDFIGLTKAMGILNAYILPLPYLFVVVIPYFLSANVVYQSEAWLPVRLAVHTLLMTPTFVQLAIFIRARNYQWRSRV